MDVTWSSMPESSNPRGRLTSAPLLSAWPWCVCVCVFTLSLSPDFPGLIESWLRIGAQWQRTSVGCQDIREAPAESTVDAQKTAHSDRHTCTASQSFLYIYKEEKSYIKNGYKNRQGDIYYLLWLLWKHNLRQTVCCEWLQKVIKDPGWGYSSFWPILSSADGAHTSQWRTAGVKNLSSFSCFALFFPLIPFPFSFTPSSSRHWMRAKQNVDPDSLASLVERALQGLGSGHKQRRATIGRRQPTGSIPYRFCWCTRTKSEKKRQKSVSGLRKAFFWFYFFEITSALSVHESPRRRSDRIYLQRGLTCQVSAGQSPRGQAILRTSSGKK